MTHPAAPNALLNSEDFALEYDDLRDWLAEAERLGEVKQIIGADWREEIGMAAELVSHSDKTPALLFNEIPGFAKGFRVLVNIFGGRRRNMTLGFPAHYNKLELSESFSRVFAPRERALAPVEVADGPIFENVLEGHQVDLDLIPTPKWHEGDGGRYIGTGSYNVTRDPDTGAINVGCYRIMQHDKTSVTYNAGPGKHGRQHHEKYIARGEEMPVVMVLGGDPMTFLCAGSEIPADICEYDVVGGIRGRPLKLVRGRHTGLPFPADAEIAIEGFVDPKALVPEGPFGDWTGTYTEAGRKRPLTRITAIYHRNDPILLGFPPQTLPDEYSRFRAVTRSAMLKKNIQAAGVPDVKSVWCHEVGGTRMLTAVSIKQRYPGHARQAGHIACQCHVGAYSGKWVIVVDDDIDVSNLEELIWAALTRSDPATSIDFIKNAWSSPSDPLLTTARRKSGDVTNSRMIIDACIPFHARDEFPPSTKLSPDVLRRARERFPDLA